MDQELVAKLALDARLVEANEHNNRISFRFIFINLRDAVGKKALQIFSAVHHKFHKCSMEMNSTSSHPLGLHKLNKSQQPRAHRRKGTQAGLQKCMVHQDAAWQPQNWQGFWSNPISHHHTPAPTWHQWWMSRERWPEWLKSRLITKPWWKLA